MITYERHPDYKGGLKIKKIKRPMILVGFLARGAFLLLMLTVAGHISVRLMYEIYKSERVTTTGGRVYYYEPNPVWYAFQHVGFLSWIKPAEVIEWFRYVIMTLGAPIATTGLTLGILARRPVRSALIAVGFILGIILAASDTDFAPVGIAIALAAAVGSAVLSLKMLNEGETV